MRLGERPNARIEGYTRVLRIGVGKGLPRDRDDGRKRVLDAMAKLGDEQIALRLRLLALRNVAGNLGGTDHLSLVAADWRYGQRNVDMASVFAAPYGFIMLDPLAPTDSG